MLTNLRFETSLKGVTFSHEDTLDSCIVTTGRSRVSVYMLQLRSLSECPIL